MIRPVFAAANIPNDIARRVPPDVATAYADALKAAGIKVTQVAAMVPDGN